LLAGDTLVAKYIDKHERFAKEELAKYSKVFCVLGNHEYYGGSIEETPKIIGDFLAKHAPHAELLNDQYTDYNGVRFIGTTLWASCGCPDSKKAAFAHNSMNDFVLIRTFDRDANMYRNFAPRDAYAMHKRARRFIYSALKSSGQSPVVLMTHHAPSWLSGKNDYRIQDGLSDCYYSNVLHYAVKKCPNLRFAVHGHTHVPVRYHLGNCEVISNPRGYAHLRAAQSFDGAAGEFEI
jgi:predicted MPP superfamily phosphohydrolase